MTELTFFWSDLGMTAYGLLWNIWKNRHGSAVFLGEEMFFWQNMGMRAMFFRELTFLWQNMGIRAVIFLWNLEKGNLIDYFGPNNGVILTELPFSDQICVLQQGFFMKILKKNDVRKPCFWANGHFFTKYGHEISVS